jgi:hypothetical protein
MNFQKETSQRRFLARVCQLPLSEDVQQGVGAVLVLVGFTLLLSGVIFAIVAYTGTKRNVIGSFPYVGPVLIVIGLLCIMNGYILSHKTDFKKLWFYFKRRKQQVYVEEDYCDSQELNGSISVLCLRFLVCIFIRSNSGETSEAREDEQRAREMSLANEPAEGTEQRPRLEKTSSFSPFRQTKVHPSISVTTV